MRVFCPHCAGVVDVDPSQAGNVVACPHPNCGREMAIPPAAQVGQLLAPMERCYDCGRPIPEGEVCRRTVAVSCSYSSGGISTSTRGSGKSFGDHKSTVGAYGGSTSTYAKVSLCPDCNRGRDEAAARAFWWSVVLVVLVLSALAIAFAVSRGAPSRQGAAPDAEKALIAKESPQEIKFPPPANHPDTRPKSSDLLNPKPQPRGAGAPLLSPGDGPELLPPPVEFPEPLPLPKVVPLPPTPEQLAKDRERRAGLFLRAAREKLHDGYKREALDILEEIVRKFPDTAAAKEAHQTWEKLSKD
jgi:hypothetical protein